MYSASYHFKLALWLSFSYIILVKLQKAMKSKTCLLKIFSCSSQISSFIAKSSSQSTMPVFGYKIYKNLMSNLVKLYVIKV